MDAISYSYADKQAKRIKKFINDPDSTSGVLTVPKVIASGESVTIPAGRVAILPDVQVDGTLNVQGDVFIPSGTTMSKVVEKVTSTDNAVVRFNGTTGAVQNSGVVINDLNNISILDGNDNSASIKSTDIAIVSSDPSWLGSGAGVRVNRTWSNVSNLDFLVSNGAARYSAMRIDSAGNVGIGVTPRAWQSGIKAFDLGNAFMHYGGGTNFVMGVNAYYNIGSKYTTSGYATSYTQEDGAHYWKTAPVGSAGDPVTWNNAMTLGDTLLVGDSIERNGSVGHGQVTLTGAGTVLARPDKPTLYHKSNVGLGVHSDYAIQFEVNGTTNGAMTLNNNGNLLVGTTTDDGANKLQVNGSLKATGYWNQLGDLILYNHYTVLNGGVAFSLDFTLLGDSSYDIEIIRSAYDRAPQYNRIIFTQMAAIGQYKVISNDSTCTVTLVSSAVGRYRYTVTISSTGTYNGYTVHAKQRDVSINSIS